eukprot:2439490-Pyramimonas_sp.AAC.1
MSSSSRKRPRWDPDARSPWDDLDSQASPIERKSSWETIGHEGPPEGPPDDGDDIDDAMWNFEEFILR